MSVNRIRVSNLKFGDQFVWQGVDYSFVSLQPDGSLMVEELKPTDPNLSTPKRVGVDSDWVEVHGGSE